MSTLDLSDPATIAALTDALTAAGVNGLEINGPGSHLRIVIATDKTAHVARELTRNAVSPVVVKAPMSGIFCPSYPSASEAVPIPRAVSSTDVVGFLRIGPVLLPVPSGRSGLLTKQLAETDALVSFGDPLFEIENAS